MTHRFQSTVGHIHRTIHRVVTAHRKELFLRIPISQVLAIYANGTGCVLRVLRVPIKSPKRSAILLLETMCRL